MNGVQAFIFGEGKILFEVLGDSVINSIISLFATYYAFYVSYPKPLPASGLLLFIQEVLMGVKETSVKKNSEVLIIHKVARSTLVTLF